MKKITTIIIMFFVCFAGVFYTSCKVFADTSDAIKTYGIASVSIIENIIKRELKREFNSDFKVNLSISNLSELKKGLFNNLSLSTKSINYKGFSFSDFSATTINPINRVVYKNKRLYYPEELPLKFNAKVTNDNLNTILNSDVFKQKFYAAQDSYGGFFKIDLPKVSIKDNRMYFELPVQTFWTQINMNIASDVYVVNNEILLRNIALVSGSNIIDISMFDGLISALNPLKIKSDSLSGRFCKVLIESAKIENNEINIDGNLTINANYGDNND